MIRFGNAAVTAIFSGMLLSGCTSDTEPAVASTALIGTWHDVDLERVVGSGETWVLSLNGSAVAGTGSWSLEACCGGTITIAGTVYQGGVHLVLTPVAQVGGIIGAPRGIRTFDGAFVTPNLLQGVIDGSPSEQVRFKRE